MCGLVLMCHSNLSVVVSGNDFIPFLSVVCLSVSLSLSVCLSACLSLSHTHTHTHTHTLSLSLSLIYSFLSFSPS